MAHRLPTAPQEVELKFEIEPSGLLAVRALPAFAAMGPNPVLLTSTYWDTPDHDLARAGLTLRVRRDEARRLQTVKSAEGSGLLGRTEWESEIGGDTPDLNQIADTPLAGALTPKLAKRLVPLFTTRVRRTRRLLEQDGALVELGLDEGEVIAGDRKRTLLQLELELKSGRPAALFTTARPLLAAAPLRLSLVTKAAIGYALAAPGQALAKPAAPALRPDQDAGSAIQAILRGALGGLSGAIERILASATPGAVHQTRVAARRLRAALTVAAELGSDPTRSALEAEVRWLAGELNAARDLDVLIAETLGTAEPNPIRAEAARDLCMRLERARAVAYGRADQALRSERLRLLLFDATAWAAGLGTADTRGAAFAKRVLNHRWRRACRRAQALTADDPDAHHRFRIAVKKLRYTADFFGALHRSPEQGRFLRALKRLQQGLGDLNDGAVAAGVAERALFGSEAVRAAIYAGERIGRRAAEAEGLLAQARKRWERLEAVGPFW